MAYSLLPKTFDEVKNYLTNKIGIKYSILGAFLQNSFLMIFVDVVAWAIALFMDLSDNLFMENHLFSTIRYENARKQAQFYGYIAHRKRSAQGTIRIAMTEDMNSLPLESMTFAQYDGLTINGIDYLVLEATTFSNNPLDDSYEGLPTGTYYIDISVKQGQLITTNKSAKGNQSETITIEDDSIENSVFIATVEAEDYTKVDSFFLSNSTDKHYTLENVAEMAGIKVTFGNGYRGVQLSVGDAIVLKHIKTDALEGQIKSVGFDVTFNESYQYSDTTPVEFYGITTSQMIGADDIEDIESIKYWGQVAASSLEEKAFQDDEVQLALQEFGGILKSKALAEYDISPDSPDEDTMNVIRLLVVPTSGTVIDAVTKQRIRDYLRVKMDFTDFIQFIDVEYIYIFFKFDIEVTANTPSDFASQLDSFLQEQYVLGKLDFGQSLNHSNVVYLIKKEYLDYIHRFNLELWVVEEVENPGIQTGDVITRTLKLGGLRTSQNNIKTLKILADFTTAAGSKSETLIDDGAGNINPQSTGTSELISSGTVNYETGLVTLNIKGTVTAVTNLEYQYETYDIDGIEENVDIKYNQIISYSKSQIATEYV